MNQFGKIKNQDIKKFWLHETTGFSSWLARPENLKLLSLTVGIDLKLIEREASRNSRLRVDLLAIDKETNDFVIIENQINKTDHSHLGQIVTYSALFNSKIIIWVVSDIREEHELAIEWLNNNTKEPVKLYLVRIEIIKINNSLPAPLFNVISKPRFINTPKLRLEIEEDLKLGVFELEKLQNKVLDKEIIAFFDLKLKVGNVYPKKSTEKEIGVLEMLEKYNYSLFEKYSIQFSRDLKNDLIAWANFRGLSVNEKQFKKIGRRDYKKNGVEYFHIE